MSDLTYKNSGVDLELYSQAMQKLPRLLSLTHASHPGRVLALEGGFAGLFRLNAEGRAYRDPVLVSGTDGVGTKIKVAIQAQRYDTIGIDLVAMCVNDCLCLGAEPLFFLDYLALDRDDPELVGKLVAGVARGCVEAKSVLLGGETAIMPSLYAPGDFDMAGFAVGVVEREALVDGSRIRSGDAVIGLASSGFHSNGFSLIRKVVFDAARLTAHSEIAEFGRTVADVLLEPTRIYAAPLCRLIEHAELRSAVHGMAHITGGGLVDNIERILPDEPSCRVRIHAERWQRSACFDWLERLGPIDRAEMWRVFNMGIGYVLVVERDAADAIISELREAAVMSWSIGEVIGGPQGVEIVE